MVSANNAINNTVGASISGVTNTFTITNASNTASSAARSTITVGGGSAADPTLNFNVSGVTDFEMGIDNSSSDRLTISQGTALGTNDVWRMTTSGEQTLPLQPSFLGFLGSSVANVTGNNVAYRLGSASAFTEVFDQSNDFNTNGVFTAPVTGVYQFNGGVRINNIGAAHTIGYCYFLVSGNVYASFVVNPFVVQATTPAFEMNASLIVNMTAADTCEFFVNVETGAQTVSIQTNQRDNFFSGCLIA